MNPSAVRSITVAVALVFFVLLLLGPCHATGPPTSNITPEQIALFNQSLDAVQEEVAAARSPSTWPFVLFVLSLLLPLMAAMVLLFRAERSSIGFDEQIRWLVRAGMTPELVHSYLTNVDRPRLASPFVRSHALSNKRYLVHRQRRWYPRRRKSWKRHRTT